jgi:hypothetical protein
LGGYLTLALGVSTVRYPIPERIFDYVSAGSIATVARRPGCEAEIQGGKIRALALAPAVAGVTRSD